MPIRFFVRVAAELGPLGLIALFSFLIVCANVDGQPYRAIRNALLPYMLVRMGRYGAYFSMELYFFVGLYLLNYLNLPPKHRRRRSGPCPRRWRSDPRRFRLDSSGFFAIAAPLPLARLQVMHQRFLRMTGECEKRP